MSDITFWIVRIEVVPRYPHWRLAVLAGPFVAKTEGGR